MATEIFTLKVEIRCTTKKKDSENTKNTVIHLTRTPLSSRNFFATDLII